MQDGQNLKEEIKAAISVGKCVLDESADILASTAMTHLRFHNIVSSFRNLSAALQGYLYPSEFSYMGRNDITTAMANRIAITLYETVNDLWLEKIKLEQDSPQGSRKATLKIELPPGVNVLPWKIFGNDTPQQGALQAFNLEISGLKLETIPSSLQSLNLFAINIKCDALAGDRNKERIINIIEMCGQLKMINMVSSAFNRAQLAQIEQAASKQNITCFTPCPSQMTTRPADTNQEAEQLKQIVATCAQGANLSDVNMILTTATACTEQVLKTIVDRDGVEHEVPVTYEHMNKKYCMR